VKGNNNNNNKPTKQHTNLESPRRMDPERSTAPVRRQITASPTLLSSVSSVESPLTLFTRVYNSTKECGNLMRPDLADAEKIKTCMECKVVK
jgi:hypothetical protein